MTSNSWSVGSLFMVRVAGIPIDVMSSLRCVDAGEWARDVLAREESLRVRGAELSDRLHDVVSCTVDDAVRRAVVNVRRQVFTNKLPKDDAVTRVVDVVPDAVGTALVAWQRDRLALAERTADGARLLGTDLAAARAALRDLAAHPRLRAGLLLASPSLDTYLDPYLRNESGFLTKRQRRIERSVLEYLYRTACKTSPFSTFTGLALGEFTDSADDVTTWINEDWSHHPRLNIAALGRIAELVVDDPVRRADLLVTLVSGWRLDLDRIRYVRRTVTASDTEHTVSFDAVQESLFFLRQGGNLDQMVAMFDREPQIRFRDLVRRLAERGDGDVADYDRFLAILLRLGLLQVPGLAIGVHRANPLRDFRDSVRELGAAWSDSLADRLDGPVEVLERYAHADVDSRRKLLVALRGELAAVEESLGATSPTLPQTLVYEDSRAGAEPLRLPGARFTETVGESLRSLSRLTPMFDVSLPQRLMFQAFFVARFGAGGRCDDLLKLVYDFQEELYDQYLKVSMRRRTFGDDGEYVPLENWLGSPRISAIDTARRAFVQRMRAMWASGACDADEVELDDELVADIADGLTTVAPDFLPQCHFLQLCERDGEPLAVLNRSWGGLSFQFSRFTHCFDDVDLAARLRAAARLRQPPGAVFAEITGGFATTNLNLHARLSDYEVVCPGEVSSAPADEQFALDDLHLVHDVDADRLVLRSNRLDVEVIPIYFGYLVPMALPDVPRTLLLLSPTSDAPIDVWGGVPEGDAVRGVLRRPRVRHRDVVVSRRSWTVSAELLPSQGPVVDDAERFLQWQRFRAEHGLPARVFATLVAPRTEGGDGPAWGGKEKPHYVDFDSLLSLTVLGGLVKDDRTTVVLREMLPGEDETTVVSERGGHVAELVVETAFSTRTERGSR